MKQRPAHTYTKLQPIIEEMYFAGASYKLMAELLGLSKNMLEKLVSEWGLTWERSERQKDYLASLDLPVIGAPGYGTYNELRSFIEDLYIEKAILPRLIAGTFELNQESFQARITQWGLGKRRRHQAERRAYEILEKWRLKEAA